MHDGPSLGGFVCPATITSSALWKMGQCRAGDGIKFKPTTLSKHLMHLMHCCCPACWYGSWVAVDVHHCVAIVSRHAHVALEAYMFANIDVALVAIVTRMMSMTTVLHAVCCLSGSTVWCQLQKSSALVQHDCRS